jgi:hypothetical protein
MEAEMYDKSKRYPFYIEPFTYEVYWNGWFWLLVRVDYGTENCAEEIIATDSVGPVELIVGALLVRAEEKVARRCAVLLLKYGNL